MKKMIALDSYDIQKICAAKFDCSPEDVDVLIEPVMAGYGPNEHIEYKVSVIIKQEDEVC